MTAPAVSSSSGLDLRNSIYFPTFRGLPYDDDVDGRFYAMNREGIHRPSHHWAFLAEIVEDQTMRLPGGNKRIVMGGGLGIERPRYLVRDREGTEVKIALHTAPEDMTTHGFNEKKFAVGNTIAIFYANYHTFMDGSTGLRIEELVTVKVIPCSLQKLTYADPSAAAAAKSCKHCAKENGELLACAKCKTRYCSQECQRSDWTEHKAQCAAIHQILQWRKRDWGRFDEFWDATEM